MFLSADADGRYWKDRTGIFQLEQTKPTRWPSPKFLPTPGPIRKAHQAESGLAQATPTLRLGSQPCRLLRCAYCDAARTTAEEDSGPRHASTGRALEERRKCGDLEQMYKHENLDERAL